MTKNRKIAPMVMNRHKVNKKISGRKVYILYKQSYY